MAVSSFEDRFAQRLQHRYSAASPDVLMQLSKAKKVLMDIGYGMEVLTSLQTQMQQVSLDAFLTQVEEEKEGFEMRAEVINLLNRDEFMAYLTKKQQILDAGTPFDHGPYSHRLQWYILYQAYQQQLLTIQPINLYEKLGDESFKDNEMATRTVWDDVFDFDAQARLLIDIPLDTRNEEAQQKAGFSSPEFLLHMLISSSFPNGPLKRELQYTRLGQRYVAKESVFNPKSALAFALAMKAWSKDNSQDPGKLIKEFETKSLVDLERQFAETNAAYKNDLAMINS